MSLTGGFDDFFDEGDFVIDPDDLHSRETGENWDTGIAPDIFASGEQQDIFSTKNALGGSGA
jgi:hypothetical protein